MHIIELMGVRVTRLRFCYEKMIASTHIYIRVSLLRFIEILLKGSKKMISFTHIFFVT